MVRAGRGQALRAAHLLRAGRVQHVRRDRERVHVARPEQRIADQTNHRECQGDPGRRRLGFALHARAQHHPVLRDVRDSRTRADASHVAAGAGGDPAAVRPQPGDRTAAGVGLRVFP